MQLGDKGWVWFGRSVNDQYCHGTGGVALSGKALKRGEFWQGERGQFQIVTVQNGQTTTTAGAAGFLVINVAGGTGFIQG